MGQVGRSASTRAALVLMLAAGALVGAQDTTARVRAWRAQHEPQILRELFELVAIPNVASDQAEIARNAQEIGRAHV